MIKNFLIATFYKNLNPKLSQNTKIKKLSKKFYRALCNAL
jgi:hypothetical protein